MRFECPAILVFIPCVLLIIHLAKRRQNLLAIKFSSGDLLAVYGETWRLKLLKNIVYLRALSLILIVLALARPQLVSGESKLSGEGIDIVLVLDVSDSMLIEDFTSGFGRISRIDAAKNAIREFISGRVRDRTGMIIFASKAYQACPLTLDHEWFLQTLDGIRPGVIEDGTAIGSGILAALNSLRSEKHGSKVAIVLTDGRNNMGSVSPLAAADAAGALKVKIYTIGIGSKGAAVYPSKNILGITSYKSVRADIDESMLNEIAVKSGGRYFRAADPEGLKRIYTEIDKLEKNNAEEKIFVSYRELFPLFLFPGLLLLTVEFLLKHAIIRRLP